MDSPEAIWVKKKKHQGLFSEGHAHPDGSGSPLQDMNGFLCFFRIVPCRVRFGSLRLTLLAVGHSSNFKKCSKWPLLSAMGC
jgi:hypothetical protein